MEEHRNFLAVLPVAFSSPPATRTRRGAPATDRPEAGWREVVGKDQEKPRDAGLFDLDAGR